MHAMCGNVIWKCVPIYLFIYLFIYFSLVGTSHKRHVKEVIGHLMCQSDDQKHLQVSLIKLI